MRNICLELQGEGGVPQLSQNYGDQLTKYESSATMSSKSMVETDIT